MIANLLKKTVFQQEAEKVVQLLSKEIYSGVKLPQERLVENELVEKYHVGRMVIRQVLQQLESYGLVKIEPYKGATIAAVTISQIRDNYQIVAMLEGFSIKLVAGKFTKSDFNRMEEALEKQNQIKEGDNKKWQLLNKEFHRIIGRKGINKKLKKMIRHHIQFTNYWFVAHAIPYYHQRYIEHQQIYQALKTGNAETAQRAMHNHVFAVCDDLIEHMQNNMPIGIKGRSG